MSYPHDDEDGHYECGREIDRLITTLAALEAANAELRAERDRLKGHLTASVFETEGKAEIERERDTLRPRVASIRASTVEECARLADLQEKVLGYQHPDRCENRGSGMLLSEAIRALAAATPAQTDDDDEIDRCEACGAPATTYDNLDDLVPLCAACAGSTTQPQGEGETTTDAPNGPSTSSQPRPTKE